MMDRYAAAVELWQQRNIQNDAQLAEALNGHSILFAYHSGKIENNNITYNDTREVFEHDGVVSYTGDLRTLFEIRNARDANELLLQAFNDKRPLDESLVKEFHFKLTQNTYDERRWRIGERPGEYKKHDFVTGQNEIGASPAEVAEEMQELLDELQDIRPDKALITAAYYHAKFENIHPFADGNGRTGRLTMNYLLLLLNHPPIVIFEQDRKEYYAALEAWDTDQQLNPLVKFLQFETVKTWQKQLDRYLNYGLDR